MASCLVPGQVEVLAAEFGWSTTDWDFQFDNKRKIGAACFPHIRLQESLLGPVFNCWPITIGKFSQGLVVEVYLDSTQSVSPGWPSLGMMATLGTFGLPPCGRTLGRYPFHHTERTLGSIYVTVP